MRTVVRVLAQALAVLLLTASLSHAQTAPLGKARARELYAQGQQLFRQGDFPSAQRAFEDAYRAVPNPVVLLSIAECQVRNEDFAGAVGSLRQYLNEKPSAPDRPQVEAQITTLEAKPGFVSIESVPTGAMIWVDGENSGYVTPNELSLRSGRHMITLQLTGHLKTDQPVDVGIGSRQRLSLTLPQEAAQVAIEQPVVETDSTPAPVSSGRYGSPAVWVATAIAGVALVTGTTLGVVALSKHDEYKKNPTDKLYKQGPRLTLFADVNFGIAAVASVTALVLYLTSAEEAEQSPSAVAWSLAPQVSPREVGLSSSLRF